MVTSAFSAFIEIVLFPNVNPSNIYRVIKYKAIKLNVHEMDKLIKMYVKYKENVLRYY